MNIAHVDTAVLVDIPPSVAAFQERLQDESGFPASVIDTGDALVGFQSENMDARRMEYGVVWLPKSAGWEAARWFACQYAGKFRDQPDIWGLCAAALHKVRLDVPKSLLPTRAVRRVIKVRELKRKRN